MNKNKSISKGGNADKRKIRNDIILVLSLLAIVAAALLAALIFRRTGDTVTVSVDGRIFGEYSLSVDRTVEIKNGDGYNILVIKDGEAYVKEASCPDGICSSHRPISHNGESIICLPNKVVVEVRTASDGEPDIIS